MSRFEKFNFFVLVLICLTTTIYAQVSSESKSQRAMNVVSMGVGGGATYISFEYERLFGRGNIFFVSAGAGLGAATEPLSKAYYTTMPFHVSGNFGRGTSFFEYGVGRTIIANSPDFSYLILGYRLALMKRHKLSFSFRLNLSVPFKFNVIEEMDPQFIPLGIGLGIGF